MIFVVKVKVCAPLWAFWVRGLGFFFFTPRPGTGRKFWKSPFGQKTTAFFPHFPAFSRMFFEKSTDRIYSPLGARIPGIWGGGLLLATQTFGHNQGEIKNGQWAEVLGSAFLIFLKTVGVPYSGVETGRPLNTALCVDSFCGLQSPMFVSKRFPGAKDKPKVKTTGSKGAAGSPTFLLGCM
jgi:hypothetical protein